MAFGDDPPPVTFLHGIKPDQAIYRIFSEKYFLELLTKRTMALARPETWDDPYENLIHQGSVLVDGTAVGLDPIRKSFYGQSWTLKDESDALWRIYSYDKKGVRIKTTVQKLANVLHNRTILEGMPQHSFHKCFVGRVIYSDMSDLVALMANSDERLNMIADTSGRAPAETLLFKRHAFSHEEEVRAIYNTVGEARKDAYGNYLHFEIPDDFIEEICLDPRTIFEFEQNKQQLMNLGATVPIRCSELYAPLSDALLWHHKNNP
jgi:Protein of unknown function (DUF2971)